MSDANGRRIGRIGFVMDRKLSRERRASLARAINRLRQHGFVDVWDTDDENVVLGHMANEPYQLLFAPWHLYRKWTKVEGALGLSRTSGPTFCAYLGEPLAPTALEEPPVHQRLMLFDFTALSPNEIAVLVTALARDNQRNGIRALVSPQTTVYCENWLPHQGAGARLDTLFTLPEMKELPWPARAPSIRIACLALWSLIYEEGPGKGDNSQVGAPGAPKAYFQVAFDQAFLVMRLFYAHKTPNIKALLETFYPNTDPAAQPYHAASRVLARHTDFLRVQTIQDTGDVEIVAGFAASAPLEAHPNDVRTLWIEPISPALVTEVPYEAPGKDSPHLKALPSAPVSGPAVATASLEADKRKDRLLREAAEKILSLKKMVGERDATIRELRSGGIGTAPPLPPPDTEALIEAFQHRLREARAELQEIETRIRAVETQTNRDPQEITRLKTRMAALAAQEIEWMRSIAKIIAEYRDSKRVPSRA